MATKARTETTGTATVDGATGEVTRDLSAAEGVGSVESQLAAVPHVDWPPDPTHAFILQVLRRQITVRQVDTETMSRQIAERALGAESLEELLRPGEVTGWEDHLNQPVTALGVRFAPSAYDEGCPVYATVDAVVQATGVPVVLTVGAWSAVYQLLETWHRGWLPATLAMVASKTSNNMDAYRLVDARV